MSAHKILVTGASSGIGASCIKRFTEKKYSTLGIARDFSKLDFSHELFKTYSQDLSDLKNLPTFLKALTHDHSDIDTLVLNAGQGLFGQLEQFSYEQMSKHLNLNLHSTLYIARAFIPLFKKAGKGTIIIVGSEASLQGKANGTLYCAGKFALRGFSQALRLECAKNHIRVCLINPGFVQTPFFDSLHFQPKDNEFNQCQPEEVAELILQQIEAREGYVLEEINLAPLHKQVSFKQ